MTSESTNHLSDEALNDVFIGMGSSESEVHLASCALCRERVERFQLGLDTFSKTTLAWSESRSDRMEPVRVRRPVLGIHLYTPMRWALAAVLLLAIALPVWRSGGRFWSNQSTAHVPAQEDSDAQIAQDNELLKAVDGAITQDDASLNNEFQFLERTHPRAKARTE